MPLNRRKVHSRDLFKVTRHNNGIYRNSKEQCESNLKDQKTSLESALNEKRTIERQFNQQKSTINQIKSEKEAAESQSSYCRRKLSSKRSEIYTLESENDRLENAEERCKTELRDQKTSFTSIEGCYNLLVNSEFNRNDAKLSKISTNYYYSKLLCQ